VKTSRAVGFFGLVTAATLSYSWFSPLPSASAAGSSTFQAASASSDAAIAGGKVFLNNCSMCHGAEMAGHPPTFPSLAGVGKTMSVDDIKQLVRSGRKAMPSFPPDRLSDGDLNNLVAYLTTNQTFTGPQTPTAPPATAPTAMAAPPHVVGGPGASLFQQNCAFCHGRDAAGGESGPDLTRSKLVAQDVNGSTIAPVVRNGRAEGKMPKFNFSDSEMTELINFIHAQAKQAASRPGGRRGVDVADLQTGNVDAGKAYFNGAGGCSKCHSPTGDLAGIASRYQGLQLEERMLYPRDAKDTATVTLPSGQTVKGTVEYHDEFTLGVRDADGVYRSWPVNAVKYKIDSPVTAHADQFPKYTDDDIHNLMAYIQTLK
jgi:mono/diheme cytochrome c family protein